MKKLAIDFERAPRTDLIIMLFEMLRNVKRP